MKIRNATKDDIPFIVNAIIEIEKTSDSNTYNNLFGTETETTKEYLAAFLNDDENLDTELSLNTYSIVEVNGENAACCSLFFTDPNYYQNKSELFPVHLEKAHLENFVQTVKELPNTHQFSKNKYFLEYLFVAPAFRSKGISKPLIEYLAAKTPRLYLIPLVNNTFAVEYYKRMGFVLDQETGSFPIDRGLNPVYPYHEKVMLYRDQV